MFYKFFDKKLKGSGVNVPLEFNEQLAEELTSQLLEIKKKTVCSGFIDNIWGAD